VSGRDLAYLVSVPIERVKGVGDRIGAKLRDAGIATVVDLMFHFPRRHIDRSLVVDLSDLPIGREVTVIGAVVKIATRRPRRGLTIVEAQVTQDVPSYDVRDDGDGWSAVPSAGDELPVMSFPTRQEAEAWAAEVRPGASPVVWATFFNQPFRQRQLAPGTEVALSGKVERYRGRLQMKSPVVDVLGREGHRRTGRIVPVYPSIAGITSWRLEQMIANAVRRSQPIDDPIPVEILERHGLVGRDDAISGIHFPDAMHRYDDARTRLVFDELFRLEIALALKKRAQIDGADGISHSVGTGLVDAFLESLPFTPTGAQLRVIDEIKSDMHTPHPMHRLLQGEVGSGKTVVAMAALLVGVQGGYQGAVMAPTEVLAEQHYLGLAPLAALVGVRMGLLTSSSRDREEVLGELAAGRLDVLVGTHALIQEGVVFERLGIAIVDEQHRFGVHQRVQLRDKASGPQPDLLIMTATPIPRTLSMTLYGDLDVSILDEMPEGRVPVRTIAAGGFDEVLALIRDEVGSGRQAFVVCPLVEESAKLQVASATAEYERLTKILGDLEVGLLHGQMRPADKEAVMARMRAGDIDVLVATTVIEVGIDIPNATVMVVEDADRFGLSQLHQLRGRVGRGEHPGTCVLVADPTTQEGEARIAAMLSTNDGFRLAEEDLRIRGQGTVFGERQAGVADLRLADILQDAEMLIEARREAFALVAADPHLETRPRVLAEVKALLGDAAEWLFIS
jgi:ATP-dependent DNA helicase RecG